ncbi:MAG TPA: sulfatase-like hydrolase/transferase [Actinomycetota bacterium]|nr:sulfatase-like hydrolase/transferase [Actinomycetota bacterium]
MPLAHGSGRRKLLRGSTAGFLAVVAIAAATSSADRVDALVNSSSPNILIILWPFEDPPPYFDRYIRTEGRSYYGGLWNVNGIVGHLPGYSTNIMADAASLFITEQTASPQPWFLMVGTVAPHKPSVPENKYARARVKRWEGNPAVTDEARARAKPVYVRKTKASLREGRRYRKQQLRTLVSVDDLVGEVFAALQSTSQDRNTLAFFLSDNAVMWGEYGLLEKGYPYTTSARIPMMMRWPARMGGGGVDHRVVGNIDIAPTVLDAIGLPAGPVHPMDGRSLLDKTWTRDWILLEYWRNMKKSIPWASLWSKKWQYIENYQGDRFLELYDLDSDPWQLDNLLAGPSPRKPVDASIFSEKLRRAKLCRGTDGPFACP